MNLLNNIFGISQRSTGQIDENGNVTIQKIESYDLVGNPGYNSARIDFSDTLEELKRIQDLLKRQQLLENRKEKIEKLNNLQ